ncbi:hypothetical protein F7Q91_03085 [Vibrio chagasii]|uniref:Uncharacterized protein n=1 Tax=Vibrio chagasii TaxID=170679 RepID=A0A7V7NX76_9VIBR|nr:DotH/IcmK family type IV secretion protein [Vibrio chagasii]KAB0482406.1 hypothetical protein F7Q91_03085 [Vibrio chagasii]
MAQKNIVSNITLGLCWAALLSFSNPVLSNVLTEDEVVSALLFKYGGIEEVLIHVDELSVPQQNAMQRYITNLEYLKLQSNYKNRTKLELLGAENAQNDLYLQHKINSDPNFIEKMRLLEQQAVFAKNKLLHEPPKSLIDTVPFDPSLPQELNLQVYPGFPGAISFFDQTGAPWPILLVKQGTDGVFKSEKMPNNSYSLEAQTAGVTNSGWFVLEGLDTTIPFRITSQNTDYFNSRRQVILPLIGPNAKPLKYTSSSRVDVAKAGPEFYSFLSGTTNGVSGAKEAKLEGIKGQAFLYNDFVYIRTTANLRGKGSSLVQEGSVGAYNLYKLYPRSFYWFFDGRAKVKAFVSDERR